MPRRWDGASLTGAAIVSVVVPTLDSSRSLERCLASLDRQTGVDVDVVIVDQESRDATREVARAAGARVVALQRPVVYKPPTHSRNVGAKLARGRYLLHLDADMELPPGALEACVKECEQGAYVALVLHEIDRGSGFWAQSKALERRCYWGSEELEGARFVRADAFWAAGGYDERLGSGEDWDVHRRYLRIGRVGESPVPLIHHLGRLTLTGQLKKKFAYGRSARPFLEKGNANSIGAEMWRAYWHSRRLLAQEPTHALGFVILRTAEVGALGFGIAVEAIVRTRKRASQSLPLSSG
jgi:glycosyltransferase involved in cell wall biosynthesis